MSVTESDELEDFSQEVFLRAFRSLDTFRGECSFKTWISKIAINTSHRLRSVWLQRLRTFIHLSHADNTHPMDAFPDLRAAGPDGHSHGYAADVRCEGFTGPQLHALVLRLWQEGRLPALGGLGLYCTPPASSRTSIPARTRTASWRSGASPPTCRLPLIDWEGPTCACSYASLEVASEDGAPLPLRDLSAEVTRCASCGALLPCLCSASDRVRALAKELRRSGRAPAPPPED